MKQRIVKKNTPGPGPRRAEDSSSRLALRERVKELTCLYRITQIAGRPRITMEEILRETVELLPPAWLYPAIASARIVLDGQSYKTHHFREGPWKQTAELIVGGKERGSVEVLYSEKRPELDEGPFLKEERNLIDAVTRQLALIIERREAEEGRMELLDQLRHSDRLATIGQLAAGVAHELNEPLGNILGFAQLAKKVPEVPEQAGRDLENIVTASLRAREIVKKLLFFTRQMPTRMTRTNLNEVIEQGLYLVEARCVKEGVKLVRELSAKLPEITADPAQLNQVLINLVVNALQAMPGGGRLTVKTGVRDGSVLLVVEDTGGGMSEEVMEHIFDPFFTTKEVDQGTGLGLPVVHGIVISHGGAIRVKSKVGRGTRFEVRLPSGGPADEEKTE